MWDLVEHGRRGDDPSFVYVEYAAPEAYMVGYGPDLNLSHPDWVRTGCSTSAAS